MSNPKIPVDVSTHTHTLSLSRMGLDHKLEKYSLPTHSQLRLSPGCVCWTHLSLSLVARDWQKNDG